MGLGRSGAGSGGVPRAYGRSSHQGHSPGRLGDALIDGRPARAHSDPLGSTRQLLRPRVDGKFLWVGDEKLYVKGVTYGTFRTDEDGVERLDPQRVSSDFQSMRENGINAVRTYTVPPRWLLDVAEEHGLYVMVGLPWEQHVTFLDERSRARSIERRVREAVRSLAGHPAVLAYAVGNEIPAPIVRWHGRKRIERFLERLYSAAKDADPEGLTTYVNYPSTEYLELPFVDVYAFNVFLERREELERYLARVQNIAGDRPLFLAEIGLDSRRHGVRAQAESLEWQIRTTFEAAAAGAFVFSWTDEWHRGGHEIEDWDFGLTDRLRRPKPALDAVRRAYAAIPFRERPWPRVSVVVCSYNGEGTIGRTCEGLLSLDYPDYEVIVVDDGSTDTTTASIAEEYGFRVICTENRGLSAARNTGRSAATGEYVAYLDDDAWPDRDWLKYLVHTFESGGYEAVGGPNIPPSDESATAQCVARSPGGPVHVLFDDVRAEHVPGCNLAARRSVLEDVGGFDPQFRVAGDDVDLSWRILERGGTIGFSPGAMVWHRRRETFGRFLRQQQGYGRAEALLQRKWPEKYNIGGHPRWSGRIYGPGNPTPLGGRWRVYYGTWGAGLFQRLYKPAPRITASLPLTPEWWLLLLVLTTLSALALLWAPLSVAAVALSLTVGVTIGQAALAASRSWAGERSSRRQRLVTTCMHLAQPIARLSGRLGYGPPARRHAAAGLAVPIPRRLTVWSDEWRSVESRLAAAERAALEQGSALIRGGDFDRWDLEVRGGVFGGARLRQAVEEHGSGRQLARFRITPRFSVMALVGLLLFLGPAALAMVDGAVVVGTALGLLGLVVAALALREASASTGLLLSSERPEPSPGDGLAAALVDQVPAAQESPRELPATGEPGR